MFLNLRETDFRKEKNMWLELGFMHMVVDWMEANLIVSLQSIVGKGRVLSGLNVWHLSYVTRKAVVILPEGRVSSQAPKI